MLLFVIICFFANVSWVLCQNFSTERIGERFVNFDTVRGSFQVLFIVTTGDNWTNTLQQLTEGLPQLRILIIIFLMFYIIVTSFITVNLFIMVIAQNLQFVHLLK